MKSHKLLTFLLAGQLAASGLAAQTADDLVSAGRACLVAHNLTGAYSNFNVAVALSPTHEAANALAAATRIFILPLQPAGSNFLNSLKFSAAGRDLFNWTATLPTNASGDTVLPTNNTSMMIAFYRTNIMPALAASRTNLARVTSPAFTLSLTADETSIESVTLDYGDIRLLQAMLQGAEFLGYTLNAHNFNVVISHLRDLGETNGLTIQKILADYPSLLNLSNTTDLASSKGAITNAILLYQQASDFIRDTRPPDAVRLFNLGTNDLAAEAEFRDTLTRLLPSVTAPVQFSTNDPTLVYAGAYFAGTRSLRSLVPQFKGNWYVKNTLPDYTFGGILLNGMACDVEAFFRSVAGGNPAGIYGGWVYDLTYDNGGIDSGVFGVFVGTNLQATVVGYDETSYYNINGAQSGGIAAQFKVDDLGNWQFNSNVVSGVSGQGSFSDSGSFRGTLNFTNGDSVYLSGGRRSDSGPFHNAAGLYNGTWSATRLGQHYTGKLQAVLFADGHMPFCLFEPGGAQNDGGVGWIDDYDNHFEADVDVASGASWYGTLNPTTFKITGTVTNDSEGWGGTWTLSRSNSVPSDVPPSITPLPETMTALLGTNVSLKLNASGSPPLCVQWYSNDVAMLKATNSTLVISNVQWTLDGTYYRAAVRNCAGETNTGTTLRVSMTAPTLIRSFSWTLSDIECPYDGLVLSGSTLYGTAFYGGTYGNGAVFKVNANGTGFSILHSFNNNDGTYPVDGLVLSGSTLYGTTSGGGTNGYGTVFKVSTNGSSFTVLHTFTGDDGANPYAGLALSGGTLYGTTERGGTDGFGTVFKVNTNGTGYTVLHHFTAEDPETRANEDGGYPYAGLILSGGALYGTASEGGEHGYGTVFKVNTDGSGYTVLQAFDSDDGARPYDRLTLSGNTLYGTTDGGGLDGFGTVFKVNTDGSSYAVLHSFSAVDPYTSANEDGAFPEAGLVLFGNTLYGTTYMGGIMAYGAVFSISTDGDDFHTLYSFAGTPDGAHPMRDLLLSGNLLYGATVDGGANDAGCIFSMPIPPTPPVITAQPQSLMITASNTASFSVTASGTTPLSYQWRKDGTNLVNGGRISGATSNVLTITGALTNDTGSYLVVVTNAYGQAVSSNAVLRVFPANQTFWLPDYYYPIYAGNEWNYDSNATGEGSKKVCRIGAASTTITNYTGCSPASPYLCNVILLYNAFGEYGDGDIFEPNDAWYEYPVVDPGWGMFGSDDITGSFAMRINPGILITNGLAMGQSVSTNLQVYLSGSCAGQMTFQLQLVELTSMTVPAGTYPECLHVKYVVNLTSGTNSEYQTNHEWWAKGAGIVMKTRHGVRPGGVEDEESVLTRASFVTPPRIITPPQSRTNSIGTAASFSVEAMGTGLLDYYWQKNGTNLSDGGNISGSATTNLVVANVQFVDAGGYSVVVSNAYGCATSTPTAVLIVKDTTPPGLEITSHTDFQLLGVSAITLAGTASDAGTGDNGIASVTVNGTRATNDTAGGSAAANWSRGLSLGLGSNTISVIATDTRTNSATNVIHIICDTNKPVVSITNLTAGQRVSNAVFTVKGTASDNEQVGNVVCQINGGGWNPATNMNHWANWAAGTTLVPGTNTVKAFAVDRIGNLSTTSSVSFQFVVTNQLQVQLTGRGILSPNYSNAWLEIGRNYSLTATATNGFAFTNWTLSTNWMGGVTTNSATLQFAMASNLTLLAALTDVTKPTNTITTPTAGQRWSNSMFTVTGTAKDNWQVSNVWYQLNGAAWSNALTANSWSNWTGNLALTPGTNALRAFAVDTAGLFSATNSVSFQFVVTNQLQVRMTGPGTLSPNYSNAWLEIGRNYSLTAAATNGFAFTNWTLATNWMGGATTNSATVRFTMASNLTLQATLVDVTRPTNAITAPAAGQRMSNALATVAGTASDNGKISGVWYSLNGEPWNQPATTNNWTNWTTTLKLVGGTNTIRAYALDAGGNSSLTNSRSIVSSNTFRLLLGFTLAQPLGTNGLSFNLQVSSNLNGWIQVSTNLLNWATLTNFVGTNANLNFRDAAATNFNRRFYRAVIP
jgi:uncharacterized repeat protein (TIGR03803 family)